MEEQEDIELCGHSIPAILVGEASLVCHADYSTIRLWNISMLLWKLSDEEIILFVDMNNDTYSGKLAQQLGGTWLLMTE